MLGIVFVLLVCFLRHGLIGGIKDLYGFATRRRRKNPSGRGAGIGRDGRRRAKGRAGHARRRTVAAPMPARDHAGGGFSGPILQAQRLTKRYGGLVANSDIDFTVYQANCAA